MAKDVVERHKISDRAELESELATLINRIPLFQKGISERPAKVLGTSMGQMQQAMVLAAAMDDQAEAKRFLKLFHGTALANFRFGAGKKEFDLDFDGQEIHLVPEAKTDFMAVDYWKKALDACLLCRDMDGLKFLASLDEDVFLKSNQSASDFDLKFFRLWAHFFKGGAGTGPLLVAAAEAATQPQENEVRSQFVDLIRYPEIRLLQAIVEDNAADFQKNLHDALKDHKTYWSDKERQYVPEGWISLPLAATCAMAIDSKKFSIDVESPYIPSWLYKK